MKKLLVVALLSLGLSVCAEDLQEIYDLAVDNDTQFAQAKIQRQIAGESNKQSIGSLLPQVNISLDSENPSSTKSRRTYPSGYINDPNLNWRGITEEDNELWVVNERELNFGSGYSVSLSQVLFSLPTFISFRNSRLTFESSKEAFESAEQSLIIRVVEAYFNVLRARDSLENTLARRESIQKQLEQTEQRFDVGLTAVTDVLNTRASVDQQEVDLHESRNSLDTAFLTLKRITGQPVQQLARLSEDYPVKNPEPNDEEYWVDYALRNSPQVLSSQRSYSIARWNHWNTLAGYYPIPTINLTANYRYSEGPLVDLFTELDTGYNWVDERISRSYNSLSLNFRITGGRGISQNRVSALNRENSRLQMINQRLTVEEQTRTQFRNVVQIVLRLEALERSLESSRASLEATEKGLEVGTRNILEVLNAQNSLFSAELSIRNTITNYITSMLRLKQTVGLLSEADLVELNQYMDHSEMVTPVNTMTGK